MRFLDAGESALLVETADLAEAMDLYAEAATRRTDGTLSLADLVPGARTVLFDGVADPASLAAQLKTWTLSASTTVLEGRDDPGEVEIPVVYDGADLAEVANLWGVGIAEVPALHAAGEYRVAFCGFAPGFAYCTGLPEQRSVPRRASPRARVPAGSVGLAGAFTGVYPRSSPGGWQLIGRTDAVLWDTGAEPPALLAPGTRVRFVERSPR